MKNLFKIKGEIPARTSLIIGIVGFVVIIAIWILLSAKIGKEKVFFTSISTQSTVISDTSNSGDFIIKPYLDMRADTLFCTTVGHKYQWYRNDGKIEGANNNKIKVMEEGFYFIEISDIKNNKICSDTVNATFSKAAIVDKSVLPSPMSVLYSYKELHWKDEIVRNSLYSVTLNILGYSEAIFLSILFGFIIGLFPFFRSLLSRYVEAVRFLPLAAVTGLFIAWFGIDTNMKVQFLSFGIMVYLLPVVVQRIDEVQRIYVQTAYTLGAKSWHLFRYVFWPHVTSKLIDDIRVLTAISWTYIILAEMINNTGGLGGLLYLARRQSSTEKLFAILFVIILIGIIQDRIFVWLDKVLFRFKHK